MSSLSFVSRLSPSPFYRTPTPRDVETTQACKLPFTDNDANRQFSLEGSFWTRQPKPSIRANVDSRVELVVRSCHTPYLAHAGGLSPQSTTTKPLRLCLPRLHGSQRYDFARAVPWLHRSPWAWHDTYRVKIVLQNQILVRPGRRPNTQAFATRFLGSSWPAGRIVAFECGEASQRQRVCLTRTPCNTSQ